MEWLTSIRTAIDYMEEHLKTDKDYHSVIWIPVKKKD